MAKPHGSVRIGPISLFTLIIVLCLAVLTVLSVTTSLAELSTTERQAATTTETYQLEAVGQQFVADVDAALTRGDGALNEVLADYGIQVQSSSTDGSEELVIEDDTVAGEPAWGRPWSPLRNRGSRRLARHFLGHPRRRAHLGYVLDGKRSHAGHRAADSKQYLRH